MTNHEEFLTNRYLLNMLEHDYELIVESIATCNGRDKKYFKKLKKAYEKVMEYRS